ncbi:MAG: hypothetical protein JWM74_5015, partial [Myxococcaceae bacterium]|nr:hypothetical protein [Myxococcaceae bacterium]
MKAIPVLAAGALVEWRVVDIIALGDFRKKVIDEWRA